LPAASEASPDTILVADGFSCRTQIEEGTGRRPLHFAELLKLAFEEGPAGPREDYPERRYAHSTHPILKTRTVVLSAAAFGCGLWLGMHFMRNRGKR
jgi:hypothetical protein